MIVPEMASRPACCIADEGTAMKAETPGGTAGGFSATELRKRMAQAEATRAAEALNQHNLEGEKQQAVIEEFHKPPNRSPEQMLQLIMQLVNTAADRGVVEVQIYRFPNALCTDYGRAVNNYEANWPGTLEGRPRAAYEFWRDHLQPLGFKLKAQVLEYPGGMPGDIGLFLAW
jgi:hypothetical protein